MNSQDTTAAAIYADARVTFHSDAGPLTGRVAEVQPSDGEPGSQTVLTIIAGSVRYLRTPAQVRIVPEPEPETEREPEAGLVPQHVNDYAVIAALPEGRDAYLVLCDRWIIAAGLPVKIADRYVTWRVWRNPNALVQPGRDWLAEAGHYMPNDRRAAVADLVTRAGFANLCTDPDCPAEPKPHDRAGWCRHAPTR